MDDPACPDCNHVTALRRCWRLTCPSNGARESAQLARPGQFYAAPTKPEGTLL